MGQWVRANYRVGDRLPSLTVVCFTAQGRANLVGASSPEFHMRAMDGTMTVDGESASILSAGRLRYSWGASDLATPGVYRGWFTVEAGGLAWSFPNRGYIVVTVTE